MNQKGLRNFSWIGLGIFLLMLAVFPVGDVVAAPSGNGSFPSPTLEWSLEADILVPDGEIAERGLHAAQTDAVGALAVKLRDHGAAVETSVVRTGDKGVVHSLKASGTGDVETFRNLVYRIAKPQFNILGGVTQLEVESPVREAGDMVLVLEANPSTGSSWKVSGMTESTPPTYEKHTLGYGAPQRQVIRLAPGPTGSGPIRLVYKRPWEEASVTRRLKLKLSSMPAKLDLSNPDAPTVPLTLPKGVIHDKVFPSVAKEALPEHLDWRDSGIVTPVRDQRSCGSCWAFGTVGIMESALWKNGIANKDLSEQYLVSCNKEGWNCEDGGYTAHMYHYDTPGKNQMAAGAVLESVKPYIGRNGNCTVNYDKPHILTDWRFITGSEDTVPTVDQIKSAIYTYGPITAGVCAGSGMDDYSGGIFTQDEASECDGSTNHQIILVGWDNPGQYWIMRNSWGTGWGLDGYMHIKWNVSRVGEGTSWVTTAGGTTPTPATLLYFPHVDTSLPWQTEIAVINTSPNQGVTGTLKAFSNEGQLVETKAVTLFARGRRQIIIAEEFTNHTNIGYIIFETYSAAVQGYTKFYMAGNYRAAVPAVKEVNTSEIYIPHIALNAQWSTGVSLVNTTPAAKQMTIAFNDGQSVPYTLNANEHRTFTIGSLVGNQPQADIQSAVITNAGGIIGLELFGSTGGSRWLDGILLTDKTASTLYYPHVASDNVWWTGIVAYNPAESAATITITPYSAQGALLTPSTLSIAGKGKYVGLVAGLGLPAQTAWFRIDSPKPLSGFELFGTLDGNQLAAYAGNGGTGEREGVFAKIEKNGWTGIAFVNTEDGAASVTLTAYNDSGTVVATRVLPVGAHAKVVNLAEDIFSQDILMNATYIAYSADRNVVGFQLNGTADGMMLDGLPGLAGAN